MAVEAEATMVAQGGLWSSIPADLVNRVADCLLATSDLDYYMELRAVCQHWRSSTADPRSNQHDPRFRPSRWVLLDERKFSSSTSSDDVDDTVLFVNTATGRFLRKSMVRSFLHRHRYDFVTATTGGLLVLAARDSTPTRVLNPFTGSLIHFSAPVPDEDQLLAEMVGASPTLVIVSVKSSDVYWAEPQGESFSVEHYHDSPASRLPLIAAAKCTAVGRIPKRVRNVTALSDENLSSQGCRCYAVWSPFAAGGDMLAVVKCRRLFGVFKVDAAGNIMERTSSIGSLALFLGVRCVAVDANCFATIEPNCIYFQGRSDYLIHKVDITGTNEEQEPEFVEDAADYTRIVHMVEESSLVADLCAYWGAPFTVTQTLVNYTMSLPHRHPRTWGTQLFSCPGCADYQNECSICEFEDSTDED